jgi:Do/DeqQ family serine protease
MFMKKIGSLLLVSVFSGVITLGAYKLFLEPNTSNTITTAAPNYSRAVNLGAENIDFTVAAENTIHSVVHVTNKTNQRIYRNDPFEFFFGNRGNGAQGMEPQMQIGTGSGVIISEDGYIVTNNHVIENANELEVTLNDNKIYKATLVGTDSKMDIALLKIDADVKLPFTVFGDSDAIKVGEWVLAVGNPYNLNSTVTAGIVSAKARDLSNQGLQSFIQTDAAVNPGNSGGALVNNRGELIGINTMISSPTGSYAGYSFAVPSNTTRKIIEDLMQFGNVQRGVLGVEGGDLSAPLAKEKDLKIEKGFYIAKTTKNSGAQKAGLQEGDVIIGIDNKVVNGIKDITSHIVTKRPNEVVNVKINRNGKEKVLAVTLTNKELLVYEAKGIEFEEISKADKKEFKIENGVKIKTITNEELQPYANELEGNIIVSVDGMAANNVEMVSNYLKKKDENNRSQVIVINRKGERLRFLL